MPPLTHFFSISDILVKSPLNSVLSGLVCWVEGSEMEETAKIILLVCTRIFQ
jgi:hypothetical protein